MYRLFVSLINVLLISLLISCSESSKKDMEIKQKTAADILGNPNYLAISYGGYREKTREIQPSLAELKDDMKILSAMGVKILRTYNVQLPHASNVLKAITNLKKEDPTFEMYVMLGAWIDCKNAWTGKEPDHTQESEQNEGEIQRAVTLANQYPDIVKIVAVGNEAMVHWASEYYVQPKVILKWVTYLQDLKKEGKLSKDLWITSSDDYASWGGGDAAYHKKDLAKLVKAVDYISMHTYPYHNTHYNPEFWKSPKEEKGLSNLERIHLAMERAKKFSIKQYDSVTSYIKSLGINKPIHIGETGWATTSDGFYGSEGSKATDEYKQALYYKHIREWTNKNHISCFYFEAFDEQWKDAQNPQGSENHFGLFALDGKAKYALWELVDKDTFKGLTRNGNLITKTFNGDKNQLMDQALAPPFAKE